MAVIDFPQRPARRLTKLIALIAVSETRQHLAQAFQRATCTLIDSGAVTLPAGSQNDSFRPQLGYDECGNPTGATSPLDML